MSKVIEKKKVLSQDDKLKLVNAYADKHKKAPSDSVVEDGEHIGRWLNNQKKKIGVAGDATYILLTQNDFIKKSVDEYLDNRVNKEGNKEVQFKKMFKLVCDYSNKNKMTPNNRTVDNGENIGLWLKKQREKVKEGDTKLRAILSENIYVKTNIDAYMGDVKPDGPKEEPDEPKEEPDEPKKENTNPKNNGKSDFDEMFKVTCNFFEKDNGKLVNTTVHEDKPIGNWMKRQKSLIKSVDDDLYIKLSKNPHIKAILDSNLKNKGKIINNPGKHLSEDEWIVYLFGYCDANKGTPPDDTMHNGYNVGNWLKTQKTGIKKTDAIYIKLSKNEFVKTNLDKYIDDNVKKLSFDDWVKLVDIYCEENNKVPSQLAKQGGQNVGNWLKKQKEKIKSKDDELYIKLSKNELIRECLDNYLARK